MPGQLPESGWPAEWMCASVRNFRTEAHIHQAAGGCTS